LLSPGNLYREKENVTRIIGAAEFRLSKSEIAELEEFLRKHH